MMLLSGMGRRRSGWRRMALLGAAALAARYMGRHGGLEGLLGGGSRRGRDRGQGGRHETRSGMGDASSIAQSSPYGSGVEHGAGERGRR